jgi:tetratricopeptide (TPR) repeat protein
MVNLICPSCGGSLNIPKDLKIAHCMYCGTKILLEDSKTYSENENYERYVELTKTALEVKNFNEAVYYCNKALEINTKNGELWIDKAIATFWLSSETDNRYDEAVKYLSNAEALIEDKQNVQDILTELTAQQAILLNRYGLNKLEKADNHYRSLLPSIPPSQASGTGFKGLVESFNNLTTQLSGISQAKRESTGGYIEAMNYFVKASNYAPQDRKILKNISSCAKKANWIDWSTIQGVSDKQQALKNILEGEREQLEKKKEEERSNLGKKLQNDQIQVEINSLEELISRSENRLSKRKSKPARTGFFSNLVFESDEDLEREIGSLKSELNIKKNLLKNDLF